MEELLCEMLGVLTYGLFSGVIFFNVGKIVVVFALSGQGQQVKCWLFSSLKVIFMFFVFIS